MEIYYTKKSGKRSLRFYGIIFLLIMAAGLYFLFANNIIQISLDPGKTPGIEYVKPQENIKIERKVFGYSVQGRPIEGYEIGSGKDGLLLFASIHGSEMGTADLLNQLVLEIALDPSLVSKTKKLIIIPVANPDGYEERPDKLNANGVNLNLNFGTSDWQKYGLEGDYAGAEPFSEIESRVMKEIVEKYKPEAMISFHSHGNLISPEKGNASAELAKWYADKTGYVVYDLWDYPGTATKWFVETTGKPSITVEISKDFQSDWGINREALFSLISSDKGLLPD